MLSVQWYIILIKHTIIMKNYSLSFKEKMDYEKKYGIKIL